MKKKLSYIDDKATFSMVMKVSKRLKLSYVSCQGFPPISGFVLKEPSCKSQLTPTGLAKYVAVLNIITGRVPQRNKWNSIYGDDAGGKQNRMNELGEF